MCSVYSVGASLVIVCKSNAIHLDALARSLDRESSGLMIFKFIMVHLRFFHYDGPEDNTKFSEEFAE